jgi:hypothetical protein
MKISWVRAMWCILWAGWLRAGEITFSGTFNKKKLASRSNFDFGTGILHIPWLKTTKFCGLDIALPGMDDNISIDINPYHLLCSFIFCYPSTNSANTPLLSFDDGSLSCLIVERHLDEALSLCGIDNGVRMVEGRRKGKRTYSGHLFRRGAATWAVSTGASQANIKRMG